MKILIVEDERAIADLIIMNLSRIGYQCDYAENGRIGADKIENNSYDLILLDIMLPEVNGYELMEYIEPFNIPVIFITAKGSVKDKVKGLHMGADDYLVKPFSIDELIARVESVLRRYHKGMEEIHILNTIINTKKMCIYQDDKQIDLTHKEYELLLFLVRNKNVALYRDVLYQKVWHEDEYDQTRTLDLHIQRLRKKLGWYKEIKTVYKVGYMLEVMMKFAEKIIWSCLLTLAVLFSIGSAIMIYQNHHNLLQTTIDHDLTTQEIELYSLETRLYQDSIGYQRAFEKDEHYLMNKAIYYLGQFQYASQNQKTFALSLPNNEVFYSTIDEKYK